MYCVLHCGILKPFQVFLMKLFFKYYVSYILARRDREHKHFKGSWREPTTGPFFACPWKWTSAQWCECLQAIWNVPYSCEHRGSGHIKISPSLSATLFRHTHMYIFLYVINRWIHAWTHMHPHSLTLSLTHAPFLSFPYSWCMYHSFY